MLSVFCPSSRSQKALKKRIQLKKRYKYTTDDLQKSALTALSEYTSQAEAAPMLTEDSSSSMVSAPVRLPECEDDAKSTSVHDTIVTE